MCEFLKIHVPPIHDQAPESGYAGLGKKRPAGEEAGASSDLHEPAIDH